MIDARSPRWLIAFVAILTALAATLSFAQAPTPARASGGALSSLTLTNANITLNAQPTPFLFYGTASAKDDTTNVVATFTSGTATYAVNAVNQGSLTSGVGSPAALNTGVTEITVTHTDIAVTTYTIKITRSFPITGFTVIDADDSTVLYDYPAPFDINTVIPPITVGHNVDRIRYRMTYADPTGAPGVTNTQTWIDNAGFCPSGTCASGEWSPPFTLAVGSNTWGPLTYVDTLIGYARTSWFTVITRQPAFTSSTLTNLQLTNPTITLNAQPTPYLFHGTASAKDDTTNVVATFTSGTATYAVNGVSQGSLTSGVGSPAALNTGITEITVTHTATDSTVTVYTIKIVRSFPITGFKVIDADDSTILYDYPAPFDDDTVIPAITVGHNVDRIRYQMTYANPTGSPGVTNTQTWIDNAGFCPSGTCASGEWSPPFTLAVGSNSWGPLTYVTTPVGEARTTWFTVITRQPAFTSSTLTNLQLTSPNITLNAQPTPFLFYGTASAKDDTTNVVATFTSGTATYAVNGVNQGSLTSGVGSPAALNTGITEITVTHTATDSTVTVYTIKITRSFPITGFTVIDADDSTVLYDYPAPFDINTVIPPLTVGHNVDRIPLPHDLRRPHRRTRRHQHPNLDRQRRLLPLRHLRLRRMVTALHPRRRLQHLGTPHLRRYPHRLRPHQLVHRHHPCNGLHGHRQHHRAAIGQSDPRRHAGHRHARLGHRQSSARHHLHLGGGAYPERSLRARRHHGESGVDSGQHRGRPAAPGCRHG